MVQATPDMGGRRCLDPLRGRDPPRMGGLSMVHDVKDPVGPAFSPAPPDTVSLSRLTRACQVSSHA